MAYSATGGFKEWKYGDGTGRNGYIVYDHGGNSKDRDTVYGYKGSAGRFAGCTFNRERSYASPRRFPNGTGRDLYMTKTDEYGSSHHHVYKDSLRAYPAYSTASGSFSNSSQWMRRPPTVDAPQAQRAAMRRLSEPKKLLPTRCSSPRRRVLMDSAREKVQDDKGEFCSTGASIRRRPVNIGVEPFVTTNPDPYKDSFRTRSFSTRTAWI